MLTDILLFVIIILLIGLGFMLSNILKIVSESHHIFSDIKYDINRIKDKYTDRGY